MTKQEVIKKIKERKWTIASTPAHLMTCHPWMIGFMRMRHHFPHYCSEMWLIIKDTLGFQAFDEGENYANLKQLYDNPKRVLKVMREWRKSRDSFLKKAERNVGQISKGSNAELARRFFVFLDKFCDVWAAPLAVDNMAIYTEGELLGVFTDALPENEKPHAHEYFAAISQPSDTSFVTREHISLLSLARLYKRRTLAEFERGLLRHQKHFYWTANSYKDIKELPVEYFRAKAIAESVQDDATLVTEIKRLKTMPTVVERNRKRLLKKLRLPKALVEKLTLTPFLGAWLDERKEVNLRGNHVLMLYLREIGGRYGYALEEVYYFTPPEIKKLFEKGEGVPRTELHARCHRLIYILEQPEKSTLFSGETAKELIEMFERATVGEKDTVSVRGVVACRGSGGVVRGRARIILDPEEAQFNDGEVLISTMTRAEYVPFMRKATAIVTDEGGITCHAAVVSRELNTPCIIGTKRATKVFKSGDRVAVDVGTGVVSFS